jgi:hypothetical protein
MKTRAQVTLEFSLAFVITMLFVVLTFNLFVWFNHCIVQRQVAFENSRSSAGNCTGDNCQDPGIVGDSDFFTRPTLPTLNVFVPGGYTVEKK